MFGQGEAGWYVEIIGVGGGLGRSWSGSLHFMHIFVMAQLLPGTLQLKPYFFSRGEGEGAAMERAGWWVSGIPTGGA